MGSTPHKVPVVPDHWISYGAVNLPTCLQIYRGKISDLTNLKYTVCKHTASFDFRFQIF